jgi:hypothetical protein
MRKRKPNQKDRHWQHEDTGMVCVSWYKPSKRWYRITQAQYQDYLSAQQGVHPTVATVAPPEVESTTRNSG